MKTVFADTGYWEALLNPRDQLHQKALSASRELSRVRMLTTEMVLDEVLAALSKPIVRPVAVSGVKAILNNPNVEVVPQTSIQFREALQLYSDRMDKAWSLTDCASFMLMRERNITESLAYDEHFEQAGFVALLRS
jgi:predicted nucleic acid-binding protein